MLMKSLQAVTYCTRWTGLQVSGIVVLLVIVRLRMRLHARRADIELRIQANNTTQVFEY